NMLCRELNLIIIRKCQILLSATPLRLSSFQLSAVSAPHLCPERAILLSFVRLCFSACSVFSKEVEESPLRERLSGG
ncbi:hypothetical protein HID58_074722, partial [Brassica napus]